MKLLRTARWLLLALLLPLIPASKANAGVFISVGFAPPVLPVYVQPACPEPGLMWTPGYWAYGDDGYYWVPGAWVPAPYEGALWTPPYWGWSSGIYVFHPGYWGMHVGYYGGVNYGFGYMGIGFVGGAWHGHDFAYNAAIVNVNRTVIRNVYVDKTVVVNNTVVNNNHIAYSGGPGGINHQPTSFERQAMGERHLAPTQFQEQHMQAARSDHQNYFNANHGRPQQMAMARPLQAEHHEAPPPSANFRGNAGANAGGVNANGNARGEFRNNGQQGQPQNGRPAFQPQHNPAQAPQQHPSYQPAPQSHPSYQQPQQRPEARPAPQPRQESRPAPEPRHESRPQKEPKR